MFWLNDSFICVTWLIHICVMTHADVWHDIFTSMIGVTWVTHTSVTQTCVTHTSTHLESDCLFGWRVVVGRVYTFMRHDSCMYTMTHSIVWHDSFNCVTWLIQLCDMTHSYLPWLIHSYVPLVSFPLRLTRRRWSRLDIHKTWLMKVYTPQHMRLCIKKVNVYSIGACASWMCDHHVNAYTRPPRGYVCVRNRSHEIWLMTSRWSHIHRRLWWYQGMYDWVMSHKKICMNESWRHDVFVYTSAYFVSIYIYIYIFLRHDSLIHTSSVISSSSDSSSLVSYTQAPDLCVAVGCSVLRCVAVCCSVLQCVAVSCRVLQWVTVCCSVLQCVAVCCGELQYVAVFDLVYTGA